MPEIAEILPFVVIWLVALCFMWYIFRARKLYATGERAAGVITNTGLVQGARRKRSAMRYYVDYRFTTRSGQTIEASEIIPASVYAALVRGEAGLSNAGVGLSRLSANTPTIAKENGVEVIYNPQNPMRNAPALLLRYKGYSWQIKIPVVILLLMPFVIHIQQNPETYPQLHDAFKRATSLIKEEPYAN